jgi:hypothetical protein
MLEPEIKKHLWLALGQVILKVAVLLDANPEATTVQHFYSLKKGDDSSLWMYLEATKDIDTTTSVPSLSLFLYQLHVANWFIVWFYRRNSKNESISSQSHFLSDLQICN